MTEHALVSVVVVTYNQAHLVRHTLDSVLNQNYPNLELVVADDCSTDQTWDVVTAWIAKNNKHFIRCEAVRPKTNQGIIKNFYNGLTNSRGSFIKIIAGDDLLEKSCVAGFMRFANEHEDVIWVGNQKFIDDQGVALEGICPKPDELPLFESSAQEQFKRLQQGNWIPAGSLFFSRRVADKFKIYQTGFRQIEDWPMLLAASKEGCAFRYAPVDAYSYRVHRGASWNKVPLTKKMALRIRILRLAAGLSYWELTKNLLSLGARKITMRVSQALRA